MAQIPVLIVDKLEIREKKKSPKSLEIYMKISNFAKPSSMNKKTITLK